MYKQLIYLVGACLVITTSLLGQKQQSASTANAVDNVPKVPLAKLVFKEDDSISGLLASPVLGYPMQCSGDGTAFVEVSQSPGYLEQALFNINNWSSRIRQREDYRSS
jgi:hypothetical protein